MIVTAAVVTEEEVTVIVIEDIVDTLTANQKCLERRTAGPGTENIEGNTEVHGIPGKYVFASMEK